MSATLLILASSSPFRRDQLASLGFVFKTIAPEVDETPNIEEAPKELALRLARAKALKIASEHRDAIVIGADQVAELDGRALDKAESEQSAIDTLACCSGRMVKFHSAVCVATQGLEFEVFVETTTIEYRAMSREEICGYVQLDNPIGCAGAIKSERAGSLLFKSVRSNDPTALIGLPLIRLGEILRRLGLDPLR